MAWSSLQCLDDVLSGTIGLEASLVDRMRQERLKEDIHLDYKHGDWLNDKVSRKPTELRKATDRLRAWVSSFANSEGGLLVVGLVAPDATSQAYSAWSFTGVAAPTGHDLKAWVGDVLRPIVPYFSLPPRFDVIPHSSGTVLIIACRRSDELVPVVIDGLPAYFLRYGDGTCRAPDYLVADLVLGRRSQATLELSLARATCPVRFIGTPPDMEATFYVELQVTNTSLAFADDPYMGCIGMCSATPQGSLLPERLRSAIDINPQDHPRHSAIPVAHNPQRRYLQPLLSQPPDPIQWRIPVSRNGNWFGAAYTLARNAPPRWYQLIAQRRGLEVHIELTRVIGARPEVKWEPLPDGVPPPPLWIEVHSKWIRRDGLVVSQGPLFWRCEQDSTLTGRSPDHAMDAVNHRWPMK